MQLRESFRHFAITALFLIVGFGQLIAQTGNSKNTTYKCTPCGSDCDKQSYTKPGKCPHCQMDLVKQSALSYASVEPTAFCDFISSNPGILILDVRSKEEFLEEESPNYGTVKNAVNIPVQQLEKRIQELAAFKDKKIVVYCSHSMRSARACVMLIEAGFKNVTNMAGGLSALKDKRCLK